MKSKLIISLILLSFLIFLYGCTTNKKIEDEISIFGKEQVQKCKENIQFSFNDFFEWDKYCSKKTAICNNLLELHNVMWNNCDEIGLETQQLVQDLFYEPYYSAPQY